MIRLRLILASSLILAGLSACTTGTTPTPGTTTPPEGSGEPLPTVVITPIPESAYPSPSSPGTATYPAPSASP